MAAIDANVGTLDETLRAIVAADRLALSESMEEKGLLHRRLTVFYGYFAALMGLSWLTSLTKVLPAEWDPEVVSLIRRSQTAEAVILVGVFLALRFRVRDGWLLRALDVLATLTSSLVTAVVLSVVPRVVSIDVSSVAFFILFFAVRAALVPSKPWVATLLAAVCAVPFTLGIALLYRRAGPALGVPPNDATSAAVGAFVAGIGGVFIVSRTIYGLRNVVERAVQLGQYVVHEKIGEGGMGTVYRASHAMLKRPTAVKLISPDRAGETATARFEREVMAASRLSHPNNVAIYDFGRTRGGVFYYAMELLDGENLRHLVDRDGPQTEFRTLHIVRQIAAALTEAHDAGLVHRDIKPENIMLCTRGGMHDFVKVLDFGLVKDVTADSDVKLTGDRSIAGTPLYMAPESIVEPDSVGAPADVYALGCVAYFLLVGHPPFEGHNLVAIASAHIHSKPEPASTNAKSISPELDRLILRCLEKDPSARPTTRELTETLATLDSVDADA